ncbi:MAG: hypothetical protein NT116_06260 [Candidatus Parcubacteria bacterium]|nr:hypothetical protein [Candidatus Parcubacteria bacterium]
MDYKELSNLLRNLSYLELDSRQKRKLIKETHGCINRMFRFSTILNKSIEEAKEKNLIQDEAYEYLKESIKKYDNELAHGIVSSRMYAFGGNDNYNFL